MQVFVFRDNNNTVLIGSLDNTSYKILRRKDGKVRGSVLLYCLEVVVFLIYS
jgi:hypothetical protein